MWSISLVPFGLKCIWLYTVSRRLAVIDIACDMNTSYTFESSPIWFSFPQFHWLEDLGLRVCHDFLVISTSLPPSLQKKKKICTHKCPLRNRGVFVDLEWCVQLLRTRCTGHIIPFYPWFLQQDRRCHDRPCDIWGKDMKPLHESSSLEDQTYKHVLKIKKRNCFLSFRWWRQCYLIYSYQWL